MAVVKQNTSKWMAWLRAYAFPLSLVLAVVLAVVFLLSSTCTLALPSSTLLQTELTGTPTSNLPRRLPTTHQFADVCNERSAPPPPNADVSSAKRKVPMPYAQKIAQGGYEAIARGSGPVHVAGLASTVLSRKQHDLSIFGSVGEIGVHHGRFTACLFINARENEKLVVADLFEQQEKNVDLSGRGDREMFVKGLGTYGLSEQDMFIMSSGSSDEIPFDWASQEGFEPFRMISVDGGHTAALTYNDLQLAFCNLVLGGIVMLDDFVNPEWMGVREGYYEFVALGAAEHVYPFLHCGGKLFLTNDKNHHQIYYDWMYSFADKIPVKAYALANARGKTMNSMSGVDYLQCDNGKLNEMGVEAIHRIWSSFLF